LGRRWNSTPYEASRNGGIFSGTTSDNFSALGFVSKRSINSDEDIDHFWKRI
jgi:hypothetical protein